MENEHFIRMEILKKLLFAEFLNFNDLKPESLENNQFNYHLQELVKQGLINKNKTGGYQLTQRGKEQANRMDSETKKVLKQGKIGGITCCVRNLESDPEFLIYTRLKHPFYGSQGYASGKIPFGESVIESTKRELKEETNLDCEGELFMIEHHRVYAKDTKELLEDKYFYFCRFIDPQGELKPSDEGDFEWVKEKDLKNYFKKPFESVERLMYITERVKNVNKELTFEEIIHFADNF